MFFYGVFFNSVNLKTLRGEKEFLNNVQGSLKLSNLFLSSRGLSQNSSHIQIKDFFLFTILRTLLIQAEH